ncbi:general secretion pathway protein GspK [Armatimonas sp.]|uniref:general secretion pathway protein GspK n=1 Tax=Armatimonas sp. TaxID=1872638 RepID=UPI003750086F
MRRGTKRAQRGGVMVLTLVILAGLMALLATFAANQRTYLNVTMNTLRERRAEAAARSGLAIALSGLQDVTTNLVKLDDDWALIGKDGTTATELTGGATYRVQILDAGSRLNINTLTEAQLQTLPLTSEQVASVLDWREAGQQARTEGAKDQYYNELLTPYNTKLASLTTLTELALVKGWTARTLYTPEAEEITATNLLEDEAGETLALASVLTVSSGAPNTTASGGARTNLNQQNLSPLTMLQLGLPVQLATQGPFTSFANLLGRPGVAPQAAQQVLDTASFSTQTRLTGKVNLNTAPEAVLLSLPGMTTDIASAIVTRQSTGFASLGELTSIPALTGTLLGQIADAACVGGDTFIVRAWGESGGSGVALEALVGIRNSKPQVLKLERINSTTIPAWWRWEGTL